MFSTRGGGYQLHLKREKTAAMTKTDRPEFYIHPLSNNLYGYVVSDVLRCMMCMQKFYCFLSEGSR